MFLNEDVSLIETIAPEINLSQGSVIKIIGDNQ